MWLHLRKERFPEKRRSKLIPRGYGPFQVIEKINDNAYRLELPGEYNVSSTFNFSDLSLFDVGDDRDLRTNHFQEGEDDVIMDIPSIDHVPNKCEPLELPEGPITRERSKRFKEELKGFVKRIYLNAKEEGLNNYGVLFEEPNNGASNVTQVL